MKINVIKIITGILLFYSLNISNTYSQDTAKIMSYNLLNYSGGETKDQNFRKSVKYANPDILVVCEMVSQAGVNDMLANVMNYYTPGLYEAGTFINGYDTDNAIFYKPSKFTFLANMPIPTDLRDINMFTLIHNLSRDTIRLFEVHLKASSGASNEAQRLVEVNDVRNVTNSFPTGTEFLIAGDFNIYGSTEAAYNKMLEIQSGNDGNFVDNYSLPGTWNQSGYSHYHSQSTRLRALSDGGATGGMDDRFDFILNSTSLTQEGRIKYIPNSLKPFGNDGNHYNDSINKQPNTAVPDTVANALYLGSDHLPVTALYKFDVNPNSIRSISEINPEGFSLYQNYPNPFNPNTVIKYKLAVTNNVILKVYNSKGNEVAALVNKRQNAGEYKIDFEASKYPSGVYFYKLTINNYTETKAMMLVK